jgi:hypothetical protein
MTGKDAGSQRRKPQGWHTTYRLSTGDEHMRNAVIRKKHLREQQMLRQFITTPVRINLSQDFQSLDWVKLQQRMPIWGYAW